MRVRTLPRACTVWTSGEKTDIIWESFHERSSSVLYRLLWIFFIYAFLGWCTEVSYAALVTGKFVNRGFLNGPV